MYHCGTAPQPPMKSGAEWACVEEKQEARGRDAGARRRGPRRARTSRSARTGSCSAPCSRSRRGSSARRCRRRRRSPPSGPTGRTPGPTAPASSSGRCRSRRRRCSSGSRATACACSAAHSGSRPSPSSHSASFFSQCWPSMAIRLAARCSPWRRRPAPRPVAAPGPKRPRRQAMTAAITDSQTSVRLMDPLPGDAALIHRTVWWIGKNLTDHQKKADPC